MIRGDAGGWFQGAAIDSRRVAGGELFFALAGRHTDGHHFVAPALAAGAAGAVVSRVDSSDFRAQSSESPPSQPEKDEASSQPGGRASQLSTLDSQPGGRAAIILVRDTYQALHALTRAVRAQVPERLVGLTGSVGKTTTKELLAAMLRRRFRVAASPGNLNNLLGFPLALLGIPDDCQWMVAEMGMSEPGELAGVSRLARPDVALLLNVRPAHLESFDSLAAIAEAKAEILAGLAPGGLLLANADDPEVARVARRHRGRLLWFGHGAEARVRAREVMPLAAAYGGSRFLLEWDGFTSLDGEEVAAGSQPVELPLHGRYNVDNALAAAACALVLGVPAAEVAAAAVNARPAAGRGVLHHLPGGTLVVDDSYNSNPEALAQALASAAALPAGRRWAVLGDMLELGPEAARFHRQAGERAAAAGFSPLAGVGPLCRELVAAAARSGARVEHFATAAEAAEWAARELAPGDVVLVKGSRGVGLEAVVERLLALPSAAGEREDG